MTAWHLHLALHLNCETANEKMVVIILTDWVGADGAGLIDIETLADSCSMTVGKTRYYLQQAVKHGHVRITEKNLWIPYATGPGFSYRVHLDKILDDE